ncbi:MAG: hypothetical protein EXR49_06255 [Dehalococcoidia bacterium]|nr:hypothetical protein [Dehalococcoidia bacterium]
MAGFKPQANLPFVAAYIAQEKGYFAAENLDVTIRHAQSGEHLKLLLANEIDVSTADAGSILKRRSDPAAPIKAIALFGQKGQNAYLALQKSGIKTVKDWEGKTFGYKTSVPPEYLAMVKAAGADRSKIKEVRVGFDVRILTEGQVDLLAVFKSNEPNLVEKLGFPVTVFDPESVGVPTLGLSYIVTDKALAEKREPLQRFVRATLRGMAFAKANEEAALDIVMKYAPQEDREHQRFMLRQELRDAEGPVAAANGLGAMSDAQWKALYDELLAYQALPQPFDYRTAYDATLVQAAYTGNRLKTPP